MERSDSELHDRSNAGNIRLGRAIYKRFMVFKNDLITGVYSEAFRFVYRLGARALCSKVFELVDCLDGRCGDGVPVKMRKGYIIATRNGFHLQSGA